MPQITAEVRAFPRPAFRAERGAVACLAEASREGWEESLTPQDYLAAVRPFPPLSFRAERSAVEESRTPQDRRTAVRA